MVRVARLQPAGVLTSVSAPVWAPASLQQLAPLPTHWHPPHSTPLTPLQLTGHFHAGAAAEQAGTHYLTLDGLVEAPPGASSWAVIEVDESAGVITVRGGGYATSRVLKIAPRGGAPAAAAAV